VPRAGRGPAHEWPPDVDADLLLLPKPGVLWVAGEVGGGTGRRHAAYSSRMTAPGWPVERLWLATADDALFTAVRAWARGNLRDVPDRTAGLPHRTLLVATPGPWRSIVAVGQQRNAVLRPMLVLKNAVALWPLRHPPDEGPLPRESWPALRRVMLIHNPGLAGVLDLLDRAGAETHSG
jgi:hypothetical protein